jgi:hypothetical protein
MHTAISHRKTLKFSTKVFWNCAVLVLASTPEECHIVATRHRELPLCGAVALLGRFLPELGRSLGSGRSFFGAARARAKDVSANTRPKDFFSTVIPS